MGKVVEELQYYADNCPVHLELPQNKLSIVLSKMFGLCTELNRSLRGWFWRFGGN